MRTLGKYQIVAEIARGGMGIVYLAVVSGLAGFNKLYVVKELKPELVEDQAFLDMFLEEARLAARLTHPNIVQTHEVGVDDDRPYIVMDYLDGQTLSRCARKAPEQLTTPMRLVVLANALEGLQYAHTLEDFDGTRTQVVHRDMSPQNIFVTFGGEVKLVDFGIAKASDTTVETRTGVFKGKPAYMAPEQLTGEVDGRADVFAVGVILWELVAGRRMWPRKTDVEILASLLQKEVPSIDDAAPDAPEELRRIVKKATAADRDNRYASAAAFQADLDAYLETLGRRPTLKEIGVAMATAFAEQRASVRQVIDKAISDARAGGDSRKLPLLGGADETSTGSGARRARASGTSSVAPSGATFASIEPHASQVTPSPTFQPVEDEPRPGKRRALYALLVAGLGLVVVGLALSALRSKEVPSARADDTVTHAKPAAAPAASEDLPAHAAASAAPAVEPQAAVVTPTTTTTTAPPTTARTTWRPAPVHYAPSKPAPASAPPATPSTTPPSAPAAAEKPKADCNPPFYFEGTKKVFKPGCL